MKILGRKIFILSRVVAYYSSPCFACSWDLGLSSLDLRERMKKLVAIYPCHSPCPCCDASMLKSSHLQPGSSWEKSPVSLIYYSFMTRNCVLTFIHLHQGFWSFLKLYFQGLCCFFCIAPPWTFSLTPGSQCLPTLLQIPASHLLYHSRGSFCTLPEDWMQVWTRSF